MNVELSMKEIGDRLRALRGVRTRTGTAKEMNISYSALCKYESGIKRPNDSTKVTIANFFGKTVQEIFFDPQ